MKEGLLLSYQGKTTLDLESAGTDSLADAIDFNEKLLKNYRATEKCGRKLKKSTNFY